MIYSKSIEESNSSEQHDLENLENEQIIAGNCAMLVESKPWTRSWFTQGHKKEHLNRVWEKYFTEHSADTELIN